MASPSPKRGMGMTAICEGPRASSSLRYANRLAAASRRSPAGLRFKAPSGARGPKARSNSPGSQALGVEPEPGAWRIVACELARGEHARLSVVLEPAAERRLDVLAWLSAGAEQGRGGGERDDGGFEARLRGAAIEDHVNGASEVFLDMARAGGADAARNVGAGRGDGNAGGGEKLARGRVRGDADRERIEAGGDKLANAAGRAWAASAEQASAAPAKTFPPGPAPRR